MEFLLTMKNETRDVETCQMEAISKDQLLMIRGGNPIGNSYNYCHDPGPNGPG